VVPRVWSTCRGPPDADVVSLAPGRRLSLTMGQPRTVLGHGVCVALSCTGPPPPHRALSASVPALRRGSSPPAKGNKPGGQRPRRPRPAVRRHGPPRCHGCHPETLLCEKGSALTEPAILDVVHGRPEPSEVSGSRPGSRPHPAPRLSSAAPARHHFTTRKVSGVTPAPSITGVSSSSIGALFEQPDAIPE
jgi:hypothetical protein